MISSTRLILSEWGRPPFYFALGKETGDKLYVFLFRNKINVGDNALSVSPSSLGEGPAGTHDNSSCGGVRPYCALSATEARMKPQIRRNEDAPLFSFRGIGIKFAVDHARHVDSDGCIIPD